MRIFLIKLINYYQVLFSPDHSIWGRLKFPYGYCRFHPSCSEYGKQTLHKYGAISGAWKIVWRILRCNPFSKGGVDFVN